MIRIITDAPADFEPHELEKLAVTCIPLPVMLDGREYHDGDDLTKDAFYALLKETGATPKTSQPAPGIFARLIEQAREAGDEVLYITMSSGISGTCQTAMMTADTEEYDKCWVFDSLNATGGQRLIVEYAVRLRDQGKSVPEIISALEAIRGKIVLYACMDTMEYLYRGGRISHTVYKLGTMAQVKPIIRVTEAGTIEVPAKAMGMRKGMDFLCKRLDSQKPSKDHNFYVMYTADRNIGRTLAAKLEELGYSFPEERIIQVGAAIGSHVGPNACGLVYIEE